MPTTKTRQRHRDHRRANERAILDATEALLATRAFRDLSIEDVMASTGLTRTAFYRYFPDLESVLLRLLEDIAAEVTTASIRWFEADPAEGRAALSDAGLRLAEVYERHGRLLAAFVDAAASSTDIEEAWLAIVNRLIDLNVARIDELCRDGVCHIAHPDQTARALFWMTERYLLETYGRGTGVPTTVAAETLAEIWHRALFSTPAREPKARTRRSP